MWVTNSSFPSPSPILLHLDSCKHRLWQLQWGAKP